MIKMKSGLSWVLVFFSMLGLGMAMPSCPGQQAMQQQIDTLTTSNTDLTKKVQALTTQITSLNNDMTQVKQLLPQMTNVIQAQKGALDQLSAVVQNMQHSKNPGKSTAGKKKKF